MTKKAKTSPKKTNDKDQRARLHAHVSGRVQMVMYRDFVSRKSRKLGLVGTVKNLRNGSVEVIAVGRQGDLETLVENLHDGPPLADVKGVETSWEKPRDSESFENFQILYS